MEKLVTQERRADFLIRWLLNEREEYENLEIPVSSAEKRRLLRSLINVRPPIPASSEFLTVQDAYLQERLAERGVTRIEDLSPVRPGIYLWQGDITTLAADAIVNAANSQMLGCFVPCHGCIDNAIHTYAGVQLRTECASIMAGQEAEPTGSAKITKAYNLPCRYVLHTVGPMIRREVTERDRGLLRACYRACLDTAAEAGLKSIAFCCISTGVFSFPRAEAAELDAGAVLQWKMRNKDVPIKVLFNTFLEDDTRIYKSILSMA